MNKDVLEKIKKWSEDKTQPKGLSDATINDVSNYCKEHFGAELPQGYKDFLQTMNGFIFDDYSIFCCYNADIKENFPAYASMDLVTFNTRFYDFTDITDYIMLGKSSLDYIGYIKDKNKYVIMTNGVMRHIGEFDSFEDMIIEFLNLS